jgi:hypothetical protein
VVTEIGACCTSGACSPARNTAFPRRARSRKGEVGGRGQVGGSAWARRPFKTLQDPPRPSGPPDLKSF